MQQGLGNLPEVFWLTGARATLLRMKLQEHPNKSEETLLQKETEASRSQKAKCPFLSGNKSDFTTFTPKVQNYTHPLTVLPISKCISGCVFLQFF